VTDEEGAKLSQQEQFARHMERPSRQEPLLPELMPYLFPDDFLSTGDSK